MNDRDEARDAWDAERGREEIAEERHRERAERNGADPACRICRGRGYTVEYHLPEGPGETLICDCVPEDDTEEGNI